MIVDEIVKRNMKDWEAKSDDDNSWVMTYGDLMSVMLVFFIMLFAISEVDGAKFAAISRALSDTLGGQSLVAKEQGKSLLATAGNTGINLLKNDNPKTNELALHELDRRIEELNKLAKQIDEVIAREQLEENIEIKLDHRGVVIYAAGNTFFQSGGATINREAEPFLDKVAKMLRQVPYKVLVEGHSDEVPIKTERFPTNWELSTARAASVVRYFIEVQGLEPGKLSAVGYAHYKPRYPLTAEYREKNRRVEIIVSRERTRPLADDFDAILDVKVP